MTRQLNSRSIDELAQLTRARKLVAEGELARCKADLAAADIKINRLRSLQYEAHSPIDAVVLDKWEKWRSSELQKLIQKKASIAAKHKIALSKFGRLLAEEEVVDQLGMNVKRREATLRKQRSYIS